MSHFSVLVIGKNYEEQLAPYHEFECTGTDDEYVQEIDRTEEALADYNAETVTAVRLSDGTVVDANDERFYRDLTPAESLAMAAGDEVAGLSEERKWSDGLASYRKVFQLPDGAEMAEVPQSTVETFRAFATDYYGYKEVPYGEEPDRGDEHMYGYVQLAEDGSVAKVVRRTNPNAKWDWWTVGGRWTGYFTLKPGATGALGGPGIMTPAAKPGTADRARKGDIDFDAMRNAAATEAAKRWDAVHAIVAGRPIPHWDALRGQYPGDIAKAREAYWNDPVITALNAARVIGHTGAEEFDMSREEYIERARRSAVATFAVVKEGVWYEKGEMGWWGIVTDEKDPDAWLREFEALVDGLPDDTMLTVIDCHI